MNIRWLPVDNFETIQLQTYILQQKLKLKRKQLSIVLDHSEMAEEMNICVSRINGDSWEFSISPDAFILEMKESIRELSGIPPLCQKLLPGEGEMANNMKVNAYAPSDSQTLQVMMLISMVEVHAKLSSRATADRLLGLEALKILGTKGGEESFDEVLKFTEDLKVERAAAVEALAAVTPKNDERAISVLAERVLDRSAEVRRTATHALISIIDCEDWSQVAMFAILDALPPDAHRLQVLWAAEGLANIAELDSNFSIGMLLSLLAHNKESWRMTIIQALERVATIDSVDAVSALAVSVAELIGQASSEQVARQAAHSLTKIARTATDLVISTWLGCLESSFQEVRMIGLRQLAFLCGPGHEVVIASVASLLGDASAEIRNKAGLALQKIAARGDSQVLVIATSLSTHKTLGVRFEAVKAIESFALPGDEQAKDVLRSRLEDDAKLVRDAAGKALLNLEE